MHEVCAGSAAAFALPSPACTQEACKRLWTCAAAARARQAERTQRAEQGAHANQTKPCVTAAGGAGATRASRPQLAPRA